MDRYAVYILSDKPRGVLYTGVTRDLLGRTYQHKSGEIEGFTQTYKTKLLLWYEMHADIHEAILREKRIKRWRRAWKIELIEGLNPGWKDLWFEIVG